MTNARNKYLDEEWEALERKVLNRQYPMTPDECFKAVPYTIEYKVFFNRGTKEIFDEYDNLLGYGEVLGEVFKL